MCLLPNKTLKPTFDRFETEFPLEEYPNFVFYWRFQDVSVSLLACVSFD